MQIVDTRSLLLALHFCREAQNPYFRLCYNSLGAYATVNHLHFQVGLSLLMSCLLTFLHISCIAGLLSAVLPVIDPATSTACHCYHLIQAYYLAAPFAVERAPTKALPGHCSRKDVEVALLCDYPVKGLVFEAGESLTATASLVGAACRRLQARRSSLKSGSLLSAYAISFEFPGGICVSM